MTNPGPLPKDVVNPERIEGMMPVGSSENPPEAGAFQSLLQKQASVQTPKPGFVSPMELAGGAGPKLAAGPTLATLHTLAAHAQTTLGDINNMLNTPKLQMKSSSKHLLGNKLGEAAEHLRTVNAKLGGKEPEEEQELPAGHGPFQQFLAYVGGSQIALKNAQDRLKEISENKESINPAEMLYVQIKMNKAQQLLDYSSVLLAKTIDGMKSLFSIQL